MKKVYNAIVVRAALAGGTSALALMASPAQAQTVCTTLLGGVLDCTTTAPTDPVSLTGITQPLTVNLPDLFTTIATVDLQSTGDVILDATGSAIVNATNQPALQIISGADIQAQVTALSTSGNNATGALLQAVDSAILVVDETVTTLGDFSDGINVTAGTVDVTVDEVSTAGIESDGVELIAVSGPATLNANLIETLGSGSTDAILRAAGDIAVNVGVLRSGGDQALGLDLQTDATACAILGAGSCDIGAVVGSITTEASAQLGRSWLPPGTPTLPSMSCRPTAMRPLGWIFRPIPQPAWRLA